MTNLSSMILAKKKSLWKLVICHGADTKCSEIMEKLCENNMHMEGGVHPQDF